MTRTDQYVSWSGPVVFKAQGFIGGRCGTARKRCGVYDQFDVTLEDSDLLGEVELTTNLIIAASEADGHLSLAEIDTILGIDHRAS